MNQEEQDPMDARRVGPTSDAAGYRHPAYRDLADGRLTAFGPDDQRGLLNLLTPERVIRASQLVKTGAVFGLNAPLAYPDPHPLSGHPTLAHRKPPTHVVHRFPDGRDDYYDRLYPQYSTQWDGFLHIWDDVNECFYNGNTDESIGVDAWADGGIVGRGVLLDVARWAAAEDRPIDWRTRHAITVSDLERTAEAQGVTIDEGTILILRTGWEAGWSAADPADRERIARAPEFESPGVEASLAMVERLWDWGVAAVAADNMAFEVWPLGDYTIHVDLLARLGMPIGELWQLEALSAACAAESRYEFLFTSAPLNAPGGSGTPANALAIL